MTEGPEEMLPEQRVAPKGGIIEVGAQMAVQEEDRAGGGQTWERKEQKERGEEGHPGEDGHAVNRQTRRAQAQDGDDKVKRADNRGQPQQLNPQNPEVHILTR